MRSQIIKSISLAICLAFQAHAGTDRIDGLFGFEDCAAPLSNNLTETQSAKQTLEFRTGEMAYSQIPAADLPPYRPNLLVNDFKTDQAIVETIEELIDRSDVFVGLSKYDVRYARESRTRDGIISQYLTISFKKLLTDQQFEMIRAATEMFEQ